MIEISATQLEQSLRDENPWWDDLTGVAPYYKDKRPRAFLAEFMDLVRAENPRRELVLLGPRRVGKTFLIHHAIQQLLDDGVAAGRILYVQIDSPVYVGMSLAEILEHHRLATGIDWKTKACHVFFDEIQYLAGWETHLKTLHDAGTKTRFVVSGSANASLGKGSRESGAGRFTDFLLPSLTFAEFLQLRDREEALINRDTDGWFSPDIEALNAEFLQYLNFGGYPEIALTESTRRNAVRFMRSDIIDKVLLRDAGGGVNAG